MITVFGTQFKVYGWPNWFILTGELPGAEENGVTVSEAWTSIRTRFESQWTLGYPVQYPNQPFTPPINSPWLRLEMTEGDANNASLGNRHIRHIGVLWIGIYVPRNTGIATAFSIAEAAAAVFENVTFDRIHCWSASIKDAGFYSGWRQITVTIPYWFDSY